MSSKPLADADRQMFPAVDFVATEIGQDAVGIVVRREVYDGGVTNLTKDQVRALFEGKVAQLDASWGAPTCRCSSTTRSRAGAPGRRSTSTCTAPARRRLPPQSDAYAIVGGNEEERTKLLSTPGSVGPLSSSFVDGYPKLAVVSLDGIEPSPENVRASRYPISRPLYLVTDGQPSGAAKTFVDYVLSAPGQQLVTQARLPEPRRPGPALSRRRLPEDRPGAAPSPVGAGGDRGCGRGRRAGPRRHRRLPGRRACCSGPLDWWELLTSSLWDPPGAASAGRP